MAFCGEHAPARRYEFPYNVNTVCRYSVRVCEPCQKKNVKYWRGTCVTTFGVIIAIFLAVMMIPLWVQLGIKTE